MNTTCVDLLGVLFATSSNAMLLVDAISQCVVDANPAALCLAGVERTELLDRHIADLLVEPDEESAHSSPTEGAMPLRAPVAQHCLTRRRQPNLDVATQSLNVELDGEHRTLILLRERSVETSPSRSQQRDQIFAGQAEVLRKLATGAELPDVLTLLTQVIERQSPGLQASILLFDEIQQTLNHGAAPNLPAKFCQLINPLKIGPSVGSCGTAAWRRERVIVEDTLEDALWSDYRAIPEEFGLRACWSQPVFATDGRLLGTFAMYYSRPRRPTTLEIEIIESAAHLAGIAIEIRSAEESLKISEQRFRQLAENIQSAFWVYDKDDSRLNYISPAYEVIFGRPAEMMTRNISAFLNAVVPEDRDLVEAKIRRQARGLATVEEYRVIRPDGEIRWIRDRAFPVKNAVGDVIRMVGVADDITHLKDVEEELQQHRDELSQVSRLCSMGELGASLAHELNQPLAAMANFAYVGEELASRDNTSLDRLKELFATLREQTVRAGEIVRRVRAFATQATPRCSVVCLSDIVHDVLQLLEPELRRRRVRLSTRSDETLPPIPVDVMQIQQALINLIRNSLNAM
jgi:PAS domain S-box-containing protein